MKKLAFALALLSCAACGGDDHVSPDATTGIDAQVLVDASLTDGGSVTYGGEVYFGGLDRVTVWKDDPGQNRCTWIVLVAPAQGGNPAFTVTTPAQWAVESARVTQTTGGCTMNPLDQEWATGGAGMVTFPVTHQQTGYPCTLDLDVALTFPTTMTWVPATETLQATGVVVDTGC